MHHEERFEWISRRSIFFGRSCENGVTRAAAKLNRVQSNVATRIRQLEEQLGTELFTREGRRLVLTPAGETLLPYAERLLALADEARHAVAENQPRGRSARSARWKARRRPACRSRSLSTTTAGSRWRAELVTGVTRKLIDGMRDFELDAALVARSPDPRVAPVDTFDSVAVYREELDDADAARPRADRPARATWRPRRSLRSSARLRVPRVRAALSTSATACGPRACCRARLLQPRSSRAWRQARASP